MNKIILKKPIITEKAIGKTAQKFYTFEIGMDAHKHHVREDVERLFNVKVLAVRTYIKEGTMRRVGRMRRPTLTNSIKYARVKIAPDQSIELFTAPVQKEKPKQEKRGKESKDKTKEIK